MSFILSISKINISSTHYCALGSRSALVNMEAKGVQASMLNRRCVFIRWTDLSMEKFLDLVDRGAGAMIILLPGNMYEVEEDVLKVSKCVHVYANIVNLEIFIVNTFS